MKSDPICLNCNSTREARDQPQPGSLPDDRRREPGNEVVQILVIVPEPTARSAVRTNFARLFTTGEMKALAKSKVVAWYMIARSVIRKNSIFQDRYLENCFTYKNFKAIFV